MLNRDTNSKYKYVRRRSQNSLFKFILHDVVALDIIRHGEDPCAPRQVGRGVEHLALLSPPQARDRVQNSVQLAGGVQGPAPSTQSQQLLPGTEARSGGDHPVASLVTWCSSGQEPQRQGQGVTASWVSWSQYSAKVPMRLGNNDKTETKLTYTSNADRWPEPPPGSGACLSGGGGGPSWKVVRGGGLVSFSRTLFMSLTVSPREKYSSSTSLAVRTRSRLAPVILEILDILGCYDRTYVVSY